jgi:(E)-4-hydroxy-3-methylbut-2-enyl-diphosphate synthase
MRKETRKIRIGATSIGARQAIAIQSMLLCDSTNKQEALRQIQTLENAGCDLIRIAVPSMESAKNLNYLKSNMRLPLIADIHFDPELAIEAIRQGVDKIRLNPSNIRNEVKIREVVACAKDHGIPIRVGANQGSLKAQDKLKTSPAKSLFEAICREVDILEKMNFDQIVLSAKASDIDTNLEVNRSLSQHFDYPLHLGLTEAGLPCQGAVKTSLGLSPLLLEGIGDTLRFSLTGSLEEEVYSARALLRYLNLEESVEVIACPTCGRCKWNVAQAAARISQAVSRLKVKASLAVMGCEVNGPGEAAEADFGIAGTGSKVLLFEKGIRIASGEEEAMIQLLLEKISQGFQGGDPSQKTSG